MTPTETALRQALTDHLLRRIMLDVWLEHEDAARDVLVEAIRPMLVDICADADAPCWCGQHGTAPSVPVEPPAPEGAR